MWLPDMSEAACTGLADEVVGTSQVAIPLTRVTGLAWVGVK